MLSPGVCFTGIPLGSRWFYWEELEVYFLKKILAPPRDTSTPISRLEVDMYVKISRLQRIKAQWPAMLVRGKDVKEYSQL